MPTGLTVEILYPSEGAEFVAGGPLRPTVLVTAPGGEAVDDAHLRLTLRDSSGEAIAEVEAIAGGQGVYRTPRDTFGFRVLYSEDVNDATVRLTHLDLGNTQLKLVQSLSPDHPSQAWFARNGPGLHHFCLKVENVGEAQEHSPVPTAPKPHLGTQGKRALFLDKAATQGVQVELKGK